MMPERMNTHCQPNVRLSAEASTWPAIPATRNAVDMAPIAVARRFSGVASARYASATGAKLDAITPCTPRSAASIGTVEAKPQAMVATVRYTRPMSMIRFRPY